MAAFSSGGDEIPLDSLSAKNIQGHSVTRSSMVWFQPFLLACDTATGHREGFFQEKRQRQPAATRQNAQLFMQVTLPAWMLKIESLVKSCRAQPWACAQIRQSSRSGHKRMLATGKGETALG